MYVHIMYYPIVYVSSKYLTLPSTSVFILQLKRVLDTETCASKVNTL